MTKCHHHKIRVMSNKLGFCQSTCPDCGIPYDDAIRELEEEQERRIERKAELAKIEEYQNSVKSVALDLMVAHEKFAKDSVTAIATAKNFLAEIKKTKPPE